MSDLVPPAQPLVTVAMPIYNAGKYLRLAVFSILEQTYLHWELLIIDDGSTDNALASIADIQDARIHIYRDGQNKGLAARLNECIDLARGDYIARMDQDDVSYPERFAEQLSFLQSHPETDLLATRSITIDEHDQFTGLFPYNLNHEEICAQPWRGFYFPHPTWMGKSAWFRKHYYAFPAPYFCEDQELLLRSYQTSQLATLDQILFAYRIKSLVNWKKRLKTQQTILIMQLHHFVKQRQYHFYLFAIFVFMGRFANAILNVITPKTFKKTSTMTATTVSREWECRFRVLAKTKP